MRIAVSHFLFVSFGILLSGCGQSAPESVATLYRVDSAVFAVQFTVKETSYGDRHNPISFRKNVRNWSFWVVVPDSIGKIEMSRADIEFRPPLPGHEIKMNSRDGWILIGKKTVELRMQIPTSSYNGTYVLKSEL